MRKSECPDLPGLLWTIGQFLREAEVPPRQQKNRAAAVKAFNVAREMLYPAKGPCNRIRYVPALIGAEDTRKAR